MVVNGWENKLFELSDFNRQDSMLVRDLDGMDVRIYEYSYKSLSLIHLPCTDYILIPFYCLFDGIEKLPRRYFDVIKNDMEIVKKSFDLTDARFPTMLEGYDILHYFPHISYVNSLFLDGIKYYPMNERYSVFVLPIEGGKDGC